MSLHCCTVSLAQVADKLPASRAVLVTAGDEGAAYCFRSTKGEHSGFVPVFKVEVADTTGAGDAFTAGFLYKVGWGDGNSRPLRCLCHARRDLHMHVYLATCSTPSHAAEGPLRAPGARPGSGWDATWTT